MAQQGYILLSRSIQDHWLWEDEPFDKARAWIDLLMLANYEDKKIIYKGEVVLCKRGDVNLSLSYLAKRWKWSRHKVTDFLDLLERDKMVEQKRTVHRTVITLVNYELHQFTPDFKDSKRTAEGQQKDITNKRNKVNKEKENIKRKTSSKFNDIIHTEYDIDDIEKKILGGN